LIETSASRVDADAVRRTDPFDECCFTEVVVDKSWMVIFTVYLTETVLV